MLTIDIVEYNILNICWHQVVQIGLVHQGARSPTNKMDKTTEYPTKNDASSCDPTPFDNNFFDLKIDHT